MKRWKRYMVVLVSGFSICHGMAWSSEGVRSLFEQPDGSSMPRYWFHELKLKKSESSRAFPTLELFEQAKADVKLKIARRTSSNQSPDKVCPKAISDQILEHRIAMREADKAYSFIINEHLYLLSAAEKDQNLQRKIRHCAHLLEKKKEGNALATESSEGSQFNQDRKSILSLKRKCYSESNHLVKNSSELQQEISAKDKSIGDRIGLSDGESISMNARVRFGTQDEYDDEANTDPIFEVCTQIQRRSNTIKLCSNVNSISRSRNGTSFSAAIKDHQVTAKNWSSRGILSYTELEYVTKTGSGELCLEYDALFGPSLPVEQAISSSHRKQVVDAAIDASSPGRINSSAWVAE